MSEKDKRILFTSHTANFNKFNRPLIRMLQGRLEEPYKDLNIGGYKIDYACACEEPVYDANKVLKVDFARSPMRIDKHIKAYRQLKKILKENNYELVHTHTPVGSIITRMAAKSLRKKGLKVIYTCHGFHFYEGAPKHYWKLWYPAEKKMAKYTDLLITINREDYNRAKENFPCPVKMIDGAGIDTTKFNASLKAAEMKQMRQKIGLEENDFAIVYIAEFTSGKNHRMLLESAAPILREKDDVKIVLLGQGEDMEAMKELARELRIEKQVLFLGYRHDVYKILQCCNLCVSPSMREGLGLGVLEAILCGCSLLIANNRGHRDIVDDNKKYLFEIGDNQVLEEKIRDAYKHPAKYKMVFPGRYSLRSSLSEMREIYLEFLK